MYCLRKSVLSFSLVASLLLLSVSAVASPIKAPFVDSKPNVSQSNFHVEPIFANRFAQADKASLKPKVRPKWKAKSELVKAIKKRKPGTEVLKVRLDENKGLYFVKVLTPKGKVKHLQLDAKR